jgi:Gram-negative bacterial TonB protein C-terminal
LAILAGLAQMPAHSDIKAYNAPSRVAILRVQRWGDPNVPVCVIHLDRGGVTPKYPLTAKAHGMPGYAIYAFEVADNGVFKSARVLGSAPHESFCSTIEEVLTGWHWKETPTVAGCRRPQQQIVHFIFQFD